MSEMMRALFAFALVCTNFVSVHPWSGNYCTRIKQSYATRETCAGSWFCWGRRTVTYAVYSTEYYCCSGWTDGGTQNCIIPVCSPPCSNGGTCYEPNKCRCKYGKCRPTV